MKISVEDQPESRKGGIFGGGAGRRRVAQRESLERVERREEHREIKKREK